MISKYGYVVRDKNELISVYAYKTKSGMIQWRRSIGCLTTVSYQNHVNINVFMFFFSILDDLF